MTGPPAPCSSGASRLRARGRVARLLTPLAAWTRRRGRGGGHVRLLGAARVDRLVLEFLARALRLPGSAWREGSSARRPRRSRPQIPGIAFPCQPPRAICWLSWRRLSLWGPLACGARMSAGDTWRSDPEDAYSILDRARALNPLSSRPDLVTWRGRDAAGGLCPRRGFARTRASERKGDDWYAELEPGSWRPARAATGKHRPDSTAPRRSILSRRPSTSSVKGSLRRARPSRDRPDLPPWVEERSSQQWMARS